MHTTLTVKGETFYIVPEADYRSRFAGVETRLVPPDDDTTGDMDAMTAVRRSIARTIIRDRKALGWSQVDLARHAKVNVETLNRIERGKVLASTATVGRLEKALRQISKPTKVKRRAAPIG